METNTNTDTNDCPRWRLCEDSIDAIEFALSVNAENGEEVGFRLVDGTHLEADSPEDARDAADYIEREVEISDFVAAADMREDIRRIRYLADAFSFVRASRFWRGGDA